MVEEAAQQQVGRFRARDRRQLGLPAQSGGAGLGAEGVGGGEQTALDRRVEGEARRLHPPPQPHGVGQPIALRRSSPRDARRGRRRAQGGDDAASVGTSGAEHAVHLATRPVVRKVARTAGLG